MGLKLTVLGCSGSYPGPGGAASGYLIEGDGTRIWLDAGSGTLANLQRHVDARRVYLRGAGALEARRPGELADDGELRVGRERQQVALVLEEHDRFPGGPPRELVVARLHRLVEGLVEVEDGHPLAHELEDLADPLVED